MEAAITMASKGPGPYNPIKGWANGWTPNSSGGANMGYARDPR